MNGIQLAQGVTLPLAHACKHALITGATGTGKSTTAGAMVEGLAAAGVPVLVFDAKGDLESLGARVWCPFGRRGAHRAINLGAAGADLIARALDLSPAQAGAVEIVAAYAEDHGYCLADLEDLQAGLRICTEQRAAVSSQYGLFSPASAAAVSRAILPLRRSIGEAFGLPGLDPFEAATAGGVTVYSCGRLAQYPGAYAAAVTACLLTLYRDAEERGQVDRPGLAVLVDEAHLVFDGATPALVRKLEQVARLVRSRGVMLIFATQSPADLPPVISAQLITRIQHGLRATTPGQVAAVKAAAMGLPSAGGRDLSGEILALGVGEALCSVPDMRGRPGAAVRAKMRRGKIELRPIEVARPVAAPAAPRVSNIVVTAPEEPNFCEYRPFKPSQPKKKQKKAGDGDRALRFLEWIERIFVRY